MGLHVDYCKGFGLTKEDMLLTEESQGTVTPLNRQYDCLRSTKHALHTQGNFYHIYTNDTN